MQDHLDALINAQAESLQQAHESFLNRLFRTSDEVLDQLITLAEWDLAEATGLQCPFCGGLTLHKNRLCSGCTTEESLGLDFLESAGVHSCEICHKEVHDDRLCAECWQRLEDQHNHRAYCAHFGTTHSPFGSDWA